jgi:hypothetical protein
MGSMSIRQRQTTGTGLILTAAMAVLGVSCARSADVLRIKTGQTIGRDLTATDGRGVLRFEGKSGQILMLNRAEAENFLDDKADKLILVPPEPANRTEHR